MRNERIDERTRGMSGGRVHNETCRLVDNDESIILVDDFERQILAFDVRFRRGWQTDGVCHAWFDRSAGLSYRPAAADMAAADQGLQTRTADLADPLCEPAVDTPTGILGAGGQFNRARYLGFGRHGSNTFNERNFITMTNGEPQPSATDLMREQRLQRNLKIVVGGLAALILLGLGAVIVRVVGIASGPGAKGKSQAVTTVVASPQGTLAVELPQGSKIVSISLSGNRLAVHHDGPAGAGIAILDLETGQRLFDVKPVESLPRN